MKKTADKKKNIILFFYIALLIAMVGAIVVLNKCGIQAIYIGNSAVEVPSMSGVITVFMMLVSLLILNTDNKKGFAAAMIINGFQFLNVSFSVFVMKNMEAVTGVPMMAGILGLLYMQHRHIKKTEQNEKRIYTLYATDPLTGLNNRRSVMEHINGKIAAKEPFSLLFFDLDDFKNINDTMGHACGDAILCETADRLRKFADGSVYLGRTGGDEFAVIISGRTDEDIRAFADKCLHVLAEKIHTEKCDYYATFSAGAARFPEDGTDCENLFSFADTAMHKAKSSGKNRICFFDAEMLSEIHDEMKLENEIRDALKYNRFYLVFQPQFEAETKHLRGFETLLRLKDGEGKPIPPSRFIPVAEKGGLIFDIDRWVLRHAMQAFSEQLSGPDFVVSVNVSARHITDSGLADELKALLDETGFPAERLEVEITESCFISSVDEAINTLLQIKKLGVKIALDDFGTGYASLSYLQKLPIDLLKIDKSFIDDMTERNDSGDFVKAIISIGHMFHCKVISEGVELESQLQILKELGCDYIQGYIWGKPQEHSSAIQLIAG
ncbi:MAG: bifunctional diguanylate cyclase/phosphodiesterase [Oscillospiraceae bacterium]|nr:bifunctional diguanylate cyclase/phosphodiesterase [Oscillospiraceae bacterium]